MSQRANRVDKLGRRRFLGRLSIGLGTLAAAVLSVPVLAYLLSPLLNPARQVWRHLGPVASFKMGDTVLVAFEEPSSLPWAGQTSRRALWLRRTTEQEFTAFAVNCTHLGCPVTWKPDAKLFLCPCHGSVFDADGQRVAGPAQRPLPRYTLRVREGAVELLTAPLPVT